jgi:hypothetical protein
MEAEQITETIMHITHCWLDITMQDSMSKYKQHANDIYSVRERVAVIVPSRVLEHVPSTMKIGHGTRQIICCNQSIIPNFIQHQLVPSNQTL